MKKFLASVVFLLFTGFGLGVIAQDQGQEPAKEQQAANHAERRAQLENMTEEERAAMKAEREAYRDSLTDEERTEHRAKMRERWASMSDEERDAMRERRMNDGKGHKGKKHKAWHKGRRAGQGQVENPG